MGKNTENFFLGVILGAAIGAITAVLLAPDKGKRTRKRLSRKFRDLNEGLDEILDKSREQIQVISEDVESNLNDISKKRKKIMGK